MILRSVGIAGAIVVFLAVAAAVTLLPALLAIVGTRIDSLAIRQTTPRDDPDGPWARLARWVMRRPVAVLIPTLAFLLLLGWPFLHVRFNAPDSTILPASRPVAGRIRSARGDVRRGRVRAVDARDPDGRSRDRPGATSRRSTTTPAASRRTPGSPGSRASSTSTRASGSTSTSCSTATRTARATGSSRWPSRRPRRTT